MDKLPKEKLPIEKQLAVIQVGNVISYGGIDYIVTELPSEKNNSRYIFRNKGNKNTVYKLTKQDLIKVFENRTAVFNEPTAEPEIKEVEEPLAFCRICGKALMTEAVVHRTLSTTYCSEHAPKIPSPPDPAPTTDQSDRKERILTRVKERMAGREKAIAALKKELKRLQQESATTKSETIKAPEVEIFSVDFVKEKIFRLLETNENIKEVEKVDLVGNNTELTLFVEAIVGPFNSEAKIEALLSSQTGDNISIRKSEVKAGFMVKGAIEAMIKPKLGQISEILKEYVEKERVGKKVDTIKIENGEFKVTYK